VALLTGQSAVVAASLIVRLQPRESHRIARHAEAHSHVTDHDRERDADVAQRDANGQQRLHASWEGGDGKYAHGSPARLDRQVGFGQQGRCVLYPFPRFAIAPVRQ
jgi:hypothetical protein